MQISKLESLAYEELRKNNLFIFGIRDLCLLLGIRKTKAYNLIKSMKRKKLIKKFKNKFAFNDINEFVLAVNLHSPSYISFLSALNYYGVSDITPRKILLVTTKYTNEINNFKYVIVSKKRFFGYTTIGEMIVAEKEKAIVDSLLFPKYSSGIKEIIKNLKVSLNTIDIKKLINYALRVESKAVLRRLGFILENVGYKKNLEVLSRKIGKGYELLDPSLKRKNDLNHKWLLDINVDIK